MPPPHDLHLFLISCAQVSLNARKARWPNELLEDDARSAKTRVRARCKSFFHLLFAFYPLTGPCWDKTFILHQKNHETLTDGFFFYDS